LNKVLLRLIIVFLFGGFYLKNKKGNQKIKFIYTEEYKTSTDTKPTEKELKKIFNQKYFKYIKRKEKRNLGGCIFE